MNSVIFVQAWTGKNPRRGKPELRFAFIVYGRIFRYIKRSFSVQTLCTYLIQMTAVGDNPLTTVGDGKCHAAPS